MAQVPIKFSCKWETAEKGFYIRFLHRFWSQSSGIPGIHSSLRKKPYFLSIDLIVQSSLGRIKPRRVSGHCLPGAPIASTVNVNTLGVKNITLPDGTALSAGMITSGEYITLVYNDASTRFEISTLTQKAVNFESKDLDKSVISSPTTPILYQRDSFFSKNLSLPLQTRVAC